MKTLIIVLLFAISILLSILFISGSISFSTYSLRADMINSLPHYPNATKWETKLSPGGFPDAGPSLTAISFETNDSREKVFNIYGEILKQEGWKFDSSRQIPISGAVIKGVEYCGDYSMKFFRLTLSKFVATESAEISNWHRIEIY